MFLLTLFFGHVVKGLSNPKKCRRFVTKNRVDEVKKIFFNKYIRKRQKAKKAVCGKCRQR